MDVVGIAQVDDRVAYRLDCAEKIVVAKKGPGGRLDLDEVVLSERDTIRRVQQISELGIRTLICGAVSGFTFRMFQHRGIRVIGGVIGDSREVLKAYMRGNLRTGTILEMRGPAERRRACSERKRSCRRKRARKGCSRNPEKGDRDDTE